MDDKNFDRLINEALKDFQADYNPSNWSQFEQKLDSELDQSWDEFDKSIKDKIQGYSVPFAPAAWSAFQNKLESSLHDDYAIELDETVKSKLDSYQVAYDDSTWPILEKKIEERKAYIRKLIFSKSIEAAIVIFAIFTFYTYFPFYHQQYKNWKNENSPMASVEEIIKQDNTTLSEKNESLMSQRSQEEQLIEFPSTNKIIESSALKPAQKEAINNSNQSVLREQKNELFAQVEGKNEDADSEKLAENALLSGSRKIINSSTIPITQIPTPQSTKIGHEAIRITYERTDASKEMIAEASKVLQKKTRLDRRELVKPLVPGRDIAFASTNDHARSVTFNSFENKKKKKIWSLGIHGSTDINYVNIPQDEYTDYKQRTFEFSEKDLADIGYGTGLSINMKMGPWSIESGIHYAYKKYDPNKNYKPAEGFSQINYKNIHMDIVEIPLNVQYRWDNEGRFRVYGVAGVAINAIAISDHDLVIPKPAFFGQTRSSSERFEVLRVKSHFLKDDDNRETYFTANLGMGVEYFLNEDHALFIEPIYKQQFLTKGIGPNQDKINAVSLKIGSRMSF